MEKPRSRAEERWLSFSEKGILLWWDSEQPNDEIKKKVEDAIRDNPDIDIVLSHTCPFKYEPREMFLSMIDQSTVDSSTEEWLDKIEETLGYKRWYCGHWHTDKKIDRMVFITDKIIRNRQFKFEGYVTKRTIAAFEAHDIECIPEWLSDAEYKALSEKSRRQYSFYQWNEYGDDYEIYSTIVRRIETLLYAYDYGYDRSFKYDEFFYDPKIRLIVEQSG